MEIKENLNLVLTQIREIEKKSGRKEGSVKLLAVSKFHTADSVEQAVAAGQFMFGENRVQEAYSKFSEINKKFPDIKLHIIGQLQTNKVKKAVQIASCIESVDRLELIKEIEKHCSNFSKNIEILFELHTAEDSKSGFSDYESLEQAIKFIADGNAPHVVPCGFMTMAPFTDDEMLIRKSFVTLRQTAEKLQEKYPRFDLTELSMGMSNDYKTAIEEGSTEVRIGTAIFGERIY